MRDEPWLDGAVADLLASCGRRLAIDIGANHGTWSIMLKPLFARVIAVEPDERCAEIYRCVVGDSSGFATLWMSSSPEQNHLGNLHPLHQSGGRPVRVPIVTLDELCNHEAPDFVKIDVEGAEDQILFGVRDPQLYRSTSFLVESHAKEAELSKILQGWGRPFVKIPHPDPCPDHCWLAVPSLT
ncbi:MAG: FkbM family methyltransferase [Verrucomicrobia bacterium]|nr:FkbM family methyltransferase [Verrucomicrobiota bacterium]